MIYTCRNVLRGLRKLTFNTEDVLSFLEGTFFICRFDDYSQTYDYTKYKGEINGIIKQLSFDGYLEYAYSETSFRLTQRGLHPYRFQWESCKSFLFRSILVPILVSLATTLLTLLMQEWL